ncbi:GTPase-activating protein CdGAPr [Condylostylus longicornis]|uniref:GTPase-activating protein CdGAPr n=1 Tax=Condylostylus longicornis TaxID=2530218 RepID=UPI00244E0567|nr:GTPase-activating protein CdGAPr [Condylostylus longicornis]
MSSCRFPKLEECAHFHYELVQLGSLNVSLVDERTDSINTSMPFQSLNEDTQSTSQASGSQNYWFIMKITTEHSDTFLIRRSFDNVRLLDEMLHRCVFDRKISLLKNLSFTEFECAEDINQVVKKYFERLSNIANDSITCGKILTWFQLDNKGRRLPLADTEIRKSINTPAVGAAYGVRRYVAQAPDEISIDVGDMISVIDMPNPTESLWWRGKKNHLQKSQYEVGFFPQNCVATIGDKIPRNLPLLTPLSNQLCEETSPTKPVLRKHGKLIAFFRSFILSRPSRRRLKQRGIYRERVFSCDLSEHLLNSGQNIPIILKCCAEFLEKNGIVDGIYRLSGITSNIQKLRRAFDEERIPDMTTPEMIKDIHAVSSVLKMYFRELPNPLCTYQLYDHFVDAIQKKNDDNERLRLMKETVLMLPPPHYRTLKHLAMHLNKISKHSNRTGMTDKNLAIVWAPNLLRSPAIESGGITALRGVGIQAVVTEYLIKNYVLIFETVDRPESQVTEQRIDVAQDFSSITSEQSYDSSISMAEKSKYFNPARPNLISLEEAQERQMKSDNVALWSGMMSESATTPVDPVDEINDSTNSVKKYHTLLPVPRTWQKRKTTSWKSLFSKNIKSSNSSQEIKLYKYIYPIKKDLVSVGEENSSNNKDVDAKHNLSPSLGSEKSPDLFGRKPIEVYVRSSSVDSVKTVQCHSRSVSHDSYFGNILQSPILNLKNFCCKEFTELVLNFDREEPEMRIFSESESLLSSPKDGFCSSCKKEKLDLKELGNTVTLVPEPMVGVPSTSHFTNSLSQNQCINEDEYSNQYSLEDHLSDIEFIDSYTPEHSYKKSSTNKLFNTKSDSMNYIENSADKQPEDAKIKCTRSSSFHDLKPSSLKKQSTLSRFSYPNIVKNNLFFEECYNEDERYSNEDYIKCTQLRDTSNADKLAKKKLSRNSYSEVQTNMEINPYIIEESPIAPNNRSSSSDTISSNNDNKHLKVSDMRTLSTTTISSSHSPRYTLLLLDTCSEPSTTMNTPVGNVNILNKIEEENLKCNKEMNEEIDHIIFPHDLPVSSEYDKDILRQKLHLDLHSVNSGSEHLLNSPGYCNNSNMTVTSDNTSQSLTPSEFGYLNFTRQSNAVSSENSPNIEIMESLETYKEPLQINSPKRSANIISFEIKSISVSNPDSKSDTIYQKLEHPSNSYQYGKGEDDELSKSHDEQILYLSRKALLEKHSPKRKKESRFKSLESFNDQSNNGENLHLHTKRDYSNKKPFLSVREIATKFETTRSTKMTSQNKPNVNKSIKKDENLPHNIKNGTKLSNKSFPSSRSLDENAFNICINTDKNYAKSLYNFNDTKHKSVEISMPKLLNPPKFLPNDCSEIFINTNKELKKCSSKTSIKQSKENSLNFDDNNKSLSSNNGNNEIALKTEQRSSNTNLMTSELSLLSGVKLDRDRIEKIKEMRRHQLSEKHNPESFISRSKSKLKESPKSETAPKEPSITAKLNIGPETINQEIIYSATVNSSSKKLYKEKIFKTHMPNTSSSNNSLTDMKHENPDVLASKFLTRNSVDEETCNKSTNVGESKFKNENFPVFKIRDVTAIFESRSQNL